MPQKSFRDAINEALFLEMRRDPRVIVLGEDVSGGAGGTSGQRDAAGGIFGVTKGLIGEFGAERVIDTPISESAIVGAGAGAALAGLRRLHLGGWGGGRDQVARLARSPHLRDLRHLRLTEHGLSEGGFAVLADPANFPKLRCLELGERELASVESPALETVRVRFGSRLSL